MRILSTSGRALWKARRSPESRRHNKSFKTSKPASSVDFASACSRLPIDGCRCLACHAVRNERDQISMISQRSITHLGSVERQTDVLSRSRYFLRLSGWPCKHCYTRRRRKALHSSSTPATTIPFRGHLSKGQQFHWLSNRHRNNRAAGARARHRRSIRFDRDKRRSTPRLCRRGLRIWIAPGNSSRADVAVSIVQYCAAPFHSQTDVAESVFSNSSRTFCGGMRTPAVPRSRGCDNFHASRQSANRRVGRRSADGLQSV